MVPEASQPSVLLYGTEACHLCELAEALLRQAVAAGLVPDYLKVDISEADALYERYGLRIPVVRRADGAELGWPFDAAGLAAFLAR